MISVDNLTFSYPRTAAPALSNIRLDVARGSLLGLLGPNGAGKTTLLSILCGLLSYRHGSVRIAGADLARQRADAQAAIALVPQDYAFYPTLSVRENLRFFARMQQIDAADIDGRVAEVTATTGLGERLDERADRLSGGLKRRLNIAIGLLNRPQLLLLDEPTVGIDPHSRRFILEAIREINRAGTTVIYTSHYMEEVESLCDDIAIIDEGKVLVQGSLEELLRAGERSRLIVDIREALTREQRDGLNATLQFEEQPHCLSIEIDAAEGVSGVLQALVRQRVRISRIQYGTRDLEELFLNFTNHSLRD